MQLDFPEGGIEKFVEKICEFDVKLFGIVAVIGFAHFLVFGWFPPECYANGAIVSVIDWGISVWDSGGV